MVNSGADEATIVVGGDVCPIGRNEALFQAGNAAGIFQDLLDQLGAADLFVANLECPLISTRSPVERPGPMLGADVSCAAGLQAAGIHVVGLANNHILDHGVQGLRSTLAACRGAGIDTFGAGENVSEAGEVLIQTVRGIRIGLIGMAEHEFSIADRARAGANPLDPIRFVRRVRESGQAWDYLVVLLHAGNEDYPYPRPSLMDICRFLVEEGADAVVCQHSHCPGCFESYRGAHIVYGQGNLIFDLGSEQGDAWHEGFLVVLRIRPGQEAAMALVPYRQSDTHPGARKMQSKREQAFRAALNDRSRSIADPLFVESQWDRFCRAHKNRYLGLLCTNNPLSRELARRFPVLHRLYSRRSLQLKLNLIRCESHRDALTRILGEE